MADSTRLSAPLTVLIGEASLDFLSAVLGDPIRETAVEEALRVFSFENSLALLTRSSLSTTVVLMLHLSCIHLSYRYHTQLRDQVKGGEASRARVRL